MPIALFDIAGTLTASNEIFSPAVSTFAFLSKPEGNIEPCRHRPT
jgi:hypothetical protein